MWFFPTTHCGYDCVHIVVFLCDEGSFVIILKSFLLHVSSLIHEALNFSKVYFSNFCNVCYIESIFFQAVFAVRLESRRALRLW